MVRFAGQAWFVDELAEAPDGSYLLLHEFFEQDTIKMVIGYIVKRQGDTFTSRSRRSNTPSALCCAVLRPSSAFVACNRPKSAGGRDWVMLRISAFADNLSSTGTKRMNPHLALASLYLFTISKDASPLQVMGVLQTHLDSTLPFTGEPVIVRDIQTGKDIMVSFSLHVGVHDGPMRVIMSSTSTCGQACHPCCSCNWGGSQAFKKSLKGLQGFFQYAHGTLKVPAHELWFETDYFYVLKDQRPKSIFHYLVILKANPVINGQHIPSAHLTDIRALNESPFLTEVLALHEDLIPKVQEPIEAKMKEVWGFAWPILACWHANPSQNWLHLNILSTDFLGSGTQSSRALNGYDPEGCFFYTLDDLEPSPDGVRIEIRSRESIEKEMEREPACPTCSSPLPFNTSFTKLRTHLKGCFGPRMTFKYALESLS
ncbi:hypothetical protein JCM10213_007512 [Rhodosporidiobolus nylandii]